MSGALYLVPVPIGDGDPMDELAPRIPRIVAGIRDFVVENERSARRFLCRVMPQEALDASSFGVLDEHTRPEDVRALLAPLLAGRDAAILSEAGSPCVADPGAALVAEAAAAGIRVVPLPGPSSILMAVMASGLGGQRFAFSGYLPPDQAGREAALRGLEADSRRHGSTQAFIETPYRNDAVAASAAAVLAPDTVFCAAVGLSTPEERVVRMTAADWRARPERIGKTPTVFLLSAAGVGRGEPTGKRDAPPRDRAAGRRGRGS
ncbi:MAG TPA: SAM-dependent methyltransferase [Spirochaetia bacterium]|nr:SAM-dependent methyltransferase [Spirochaetaceae bacterium]HPE88753.1 SAM-dependent methyltransferase [Spirochaetales bacterium]HRW24251.1 SAM-dependent methyltransferase [Spirochaetia bacterium]